MLKESTSYLFSATKNRLFIQSVKILIPITWKKNVNYLKTKTETYEKADVIVAKPHLKNGNDPYTLQYGQCGDKGVYIHFTPDFLVDDQLLSVYGPRGRVFVHEWAHLRWGVFDEYNPLTPFYIDNNRKIEATRCPAGLQGVAVKQCTGGSCLCTEKDIDVETGLYKDGCVFVPDKNIASKHSIMYLQAAQSVSEFCDAQSHNTEAPNLQNRMCNYHSTWEIIENSTDIKNTPVSSTNVPEPIVTLIRSSDRVVTLVSDVSGSMGASERDLRLVQAAEVFIMQIVEDGSHVGIVEFSSAAVVISPLVQIFSTAQREQLKKLLKRKAGGGTNICDGIRKGFEVNKGTSDKSTYGTEIVLLSDGEDSSFPSVCYNEIINSGAIIHVIALGPSAAAALEKVADDTGGSKYFASDSFSANGLIDAFTSMASGAGDISKQTIQLESTASTLSSKNCLNGTVFIDKTVGNNTFFLVTWQSAVPIINLKDPKGNIYTAANFKSDSATKSSRLEINGTAEVGPWEYSLCNGLSSSQAIGITVTSRAANESVPPVVVNAHMNQDTINYPTPPIIYASVSQGLVPVKNVKVTAIIEAVNGQTSTIVLDDDGAGADIAMYDGIYSKYFTSFTLNGRYSLKVRVESTKNKARLVLPRNRALYVPGYVDNGVVTMNPPRPVIDEEELVVEAFSRTASGGTFVMSNIPPVLPTDIFKPEKITNLEAKIVDDVVVLAWTATGDELDRGTATSYDLRMSVNPKDLRDNFNGATKVNISSISPQEAGNRETFSFVPENVVIENGTILFFALVAVDKANKRSDVSNIAQAALVLPPPPAPTTGPTNNSSDWLTITTMTLIVCSTVILICIIISITTCIVSCQRKKKYKEMRV
ncbi:calcium-activated chloride channel regulator 1-like [Hyla sarda]|uniref:calcium-activated chloride channel regulator 1-like n=1 Tax=Hyla sarda TaxID=327740 RepID=UPI0024C2F13E|nr:calcium-activated chloride channel regulator 1-like [Hyla sarda]XP_056383988.1 calcium-activated chloride channel regulator 1-like [Hyla sarda]